MEVMFVSIVLAKMMVVEKFVVCLFVCLVIIDETRVFDVMSKQN